MTVFVEDTFTEASDTTLASHTGETGASWTKHSASGAGTMEVVGATDRVRPEGSGSSKYYYASGVPDSANYALTATFDRVADETENHTCGVCARMDTSADTRYYLIVETFTPGAGTYEVGKTVAGSSTTLDTWQTSDGGVQSDAVVWTLDGGDQSVTVDGVEQLTVVGDTAITAAGRAGVQGFGDTGDADGWQISDLVADTLVDLQYLRPSADVTTTGWTTTPLWSKIDEATPDGTIITATAS